VADDRRRPTHLQVEILVRKIHAANFPAAIVREPEQSNTPTKSKVERCHRVSAPRLQSVVIPQISGV